MNDDEMKQLAAAICPGLDLAGCYSKIMPRITAEQLELFLAAAVDGRPVWGVWASHMLVYGRAEVVRPASDKLVAVVTDKEYVVWVLRVAHSNLTADDRAALLRVVKRSKDAAWVLVDVPALTDAQRAGLVRLVTESEDAAWVLVDTPALTAAQRTALLRLVTETCDAAGVLVDAPGLTAAQRAALLRLVTESEDAAWVLRKAPALAADQRAILERVANQ